MTTHMWGDGFDFDKLYQVESYICREYTRKTGRAPMTKEKYGSLRYEFIHTWITTREELQIFSYILLQACANAPDVRDEILEDFLDQLEVESL